MRLICTITDRVNENPYEFSYYLASEGIKNDCEEVHTGDGYLYRIWVYDEDEVEQALELYQEYQNNPNHTRYREHSLAADRLQKEKLALEIENQKSENKKQRKLLSPAPYGVISILLLVVVVGLFILTQMQGGNFIPHKIPGIIQSPVLTPMEKLLVYDYPHYFVLRDQFLKEYSQEAVQEKERLSSEAIQLMHVLKNTPVWMGVYNLILNYFKHSTPVVSYKGALFEKIRAGQIWRLYTPALLHLDLLHIFFNVLWFILLGNQIEFRLGWWRYLLLLLITAIVSNTGQYLMSGSFFMGLSGTVVGLAAFIWARQQRAPWEGYLLHRYTLIFLAIFVFGMFILQTVLFILQATGNLGWSVGIANTAHLLGAAVGYLMGRMSYSAIRPK